MWRQGLLVVIVAIVFWQLLQNDKDESPKGSSNAQNANEPSAYIQNGHFVSFDDTGKRVLDLHGNRANYYDRSDEVAIEQPRVNLASDSYESVSLSAMTGTFNLVAQKIDLSGDVELLAEDPAEESVRVSTEFLSLDQKRQFLSTDQTVQIQRGGSTFRARGLRAWLDQNRIKLLADVRGRYVFNAPVE